jgi:hypothetical protein
MDFEYDPQKSEANKIKHDIDFEEAKILWNDARGYEIAVAAKGESRRVLIAYHRERHWTAVFTHRAENIRIISVRRARVKEIMLYDNR